MQDRTLQRSYVKQAASRKNALNLREYPTPNRVNNINNNNNNNNMRTPQPRRYVHFEEDGTQYHYPRSNNNKNSSSSYRHSAVKGKRTRNNNSIVIRSPIEGGGIGVNNIQSFSHNTNNMTSIPDIALTDVGRRFPTLFQPSKIQVVNRMVNVIDLVPQQFRHADTIYLTNNRLSNISNMEQFKNLQTLSLAHNEINNVNQLKPLIKCPLLKYLKLEGCPVCEAPFYRLHVIRLLTKLKKFKVLDGDEIDRKERMAAKYVIEKEGQMYKKMFHNYCTIYKLKHLIFQLKLHLNFRLVRLGENLPSNLIIIPPTISSFPRHDDSGDVNIDLYLKLWKFKRYDVTSEFKIYIRNNITNGVVKFWNLLLKAELQQQQQQEKTLANISNNTPYGKRSKSLQNRNSRLGRSSSNVLTTTTIPHTKAHKLWEEAFSEMQIVQDGAINKLKMLCQEYKVQLKDIENQIAAKDPMGYIDQLEEEEEELNKMMSPRSGGGSGYNKGTSHMDTSVINDNNNSISDAFNDNQNNASNGLTEPVPWPVPKPIASPKSKQRGRSMENIDDKNVPIKNSKDNDDQRNEEEEEDEDDEEYRQDKGKLYLELLEQSTRKQRRTPSPQHRRNAKSPTSGKKSKHENNHIDEPLNANSAVMSEDKMLTMSPKEKERWERTLRKQSPDNAFVEKKDTKVFNKRRKSPSPTSSKVKLKSKNMQHKKKSPRNVTNKKVSPSTAATVTHNNTNNNKKTRLLVEKLSIMNDQVEKLQHERDVANHKAKEYEMLLHHYVKGEDKLKMAIELNNTHILQRAFYGWEKATNHVRKQRMHAHKIQSKKQFLFMQLIFESWFKYAENEKLVKHKTSIATKHKYTNILSNAFLSWHRKVQEIFQHHKGTKQLLAKAHLFIQKKCFKKWNLVLEEERIENENLVKLGYLHILGRRYLRQWKLATSAVELDRVTNTLAMKQYIDTLQFNAFEKWRQFTLDSIEDKRYTFAKHLKKTVLKVGNGLADIFNRRYLDNTCKFILKIWFNKTKYTMQRLKYAKILGDIRRKNEVTNSWYKWRIVTLSEQLTAVGTNIKAEQENVLKLNDEITDLQKELFNNKKQIEIKELQIEREKILAFKQYEELNDEVMVLNLRTENKENKAKVISQEVQEAKKGVEFLIQKVKEHKNETKFLEEENSLLSTHMSDLEKRLNDEKIQLQQSIVEKNKLRSQLQLIEKAKDEADKEVEIQRNENVTLIEKMKKMRHNWEIDIDTFNKEKNANRKVVKSLKGQIKVEETARKKKEKEFKEFTISSKVYQFKMETQLEESLQMCTMLKQELEKVSVERTLLVREKENSQLLMLHLQNKMQMEEDMQMEDIHLKTKRMNKLEGERFQLQSKYEMLIARNEERDKLLKEKNNVIRNLKQGLQLSSLNNNNVGNISNNQFNGSEISNDKSSVAEFYQMQDANDGSDMSEEETDEAELNAKLKELKEKIEGKIRNVY